MTPAAPNQKPAKCDANDVAGKRGPVGLQAAAARVAAAAPDVGLLAPVPPHDHRDGYRRPSDLLALDTTINPNRLLGNDWLCRGGGAVLAAYSGKGKSTLAMQAAVLWASGRDLFGLAPVRPLRVLMVQAENDGQDQARMLKGIVNALQVPNPPGLDERLFLIWERESAGQEFLTRLRGLAGAIEPDLVIIDPLLAYLGGSASDQQVVGAFLRNGLNPISAACGCAWLLIHHAAKPPKDPTVRDALMDILDYLDLGSVEFTNWPRAKLFLREVNAEERRYSLVAGKRGHDAGFTDAQGNPTREVFLRHARDGNIYWERDETPAYHANAKAAAAADEALGEITRMVRDGELPVVASAEQIKRACSAAVGRAYNRSHFCESHADRPEYHLWRRLMELVCPQGGRWEIGRALEVERP
jgi:hypothetical protein